MAQESLDPRVQEIRRHIDVLGGRGLEIGPLHSPIVKPSEAEVRYVDVHLTPELKAYYSTHPGMQVDDIVEVHHALIVDGQARSLPEAVAPDAPFDWVIASHVIEHVPDLVGWLHDVAAVLVDGGRLALAIPDRRYCFDALRPPTTVGQVLQAHFDGDTRPSVRAVFDHFSTAAEVDLASAWRGEPVDPISVIHGNEIAWDHVQRVIETGEYQDCHVWLFTPGSFATQLRTLGELGLLGLVPVSVEPTAQGSIEFYATLAKVPSDLSDEARRRVVTEGFDRLASEDDLDGDGGTGRRRPVELSEREERAIQLKRRALEKARRVLGGLRSS